MIQILSQFIQQYKYNNYPQSLQGISASGSLNSTHTHMFCSYFFFFLASANKWKWIHLSAANEVPEEPEDQYYWVQGLSLPLGLGSKSATKAKKNSVPTTWNKYKTVEANSTNDVCAKWVCVCVSVFMCVWDVGVVGNSASCAGNQLMMLLTLPQPAELDKQQLSEKRQGKKVAGGRRLGARESAHWLLTLDEPRWSTIFKRYVNIWQVVIVVVIVHCLFSTSLSLSLVLVLFPFFAGVSFSFFLYWSWILLHSCICFVSQLLIAPNGV